MSAIRLFAIALAATAAPLPVLGETTVINDHQPLVEGSGRIVSQARPITAVSRVELGGAGTLDVRLGSAPSLTIQADDNVLPVLTSEIRGNTLVLGSRGSYRTRTSPHYYLTVPDLKELRSSGSGSVVLLGVANSGLALNINGSGSMRASGHTDRLEAEVMGSGNFDLQNLAAGDARLGIMGSGNATVMVKGALDVSTFGSGNVRYIGRPTSLSVHTGGSGRVSPVNG